MTTVTKKDGRKEEFDRTKIERSVRSAGVDEETARRVADQVPKKEGILSEGVREIVKKVLEEWDAEAAQRYDRTRRLAAKKSIATTKGTARLSNDAMECLKLKPGDSVEASHDDQKCTLRAERDEKTDIRWSEIWLNYEDMKDIGIPEGKRVLARKHN